MISEKYKKKKSYIAMNWEYWDSIANEPSIIQFLFLT